LVFFRRPGQSRPSQKRTAKNPLQRRGKGKPKKEKRKKTKKNSPTNRGLSFSYPPGQKGERAFSHRKGLEWLWLSPRRKGLPSTQEGSGQEGKR
tara:strand:- start:72 stop:353 length:282 start_codon:yes stop_codon:yes gene_type:complete